MIKVLYLLNHAGKAGTERYVETLARQLGEGSLIQPYFVYNEGGLLVEKMEEMGVPTAQITMKSRFDTKASKALAAQCMDWDIDVVHCQFLREHYIALMAKAFRSKLKVVYTNHFVMENNRMTRVTNRLFDQRQDQMIAVCTKGKEQLVTNGWSGDGIQVIFNGVDVKAWAPDGTPSTLRQELGVDEGHFVMLCASRFASDKGHDYLVRGVKELTALTNRPFTLVLAGDGPLQDAVKKQVAQLGLEDCVKFLGFRSDMKNLFLGCDLYVNASEHEALSFLIIEAMAAGLPVIATDMGGNRDIVNEKAGCGPLVPYDQPLPLAQAMAKFMGDEGYLKDCKAGALRTVTEHFHVDVMCQKVYQIYQQVLGLKEK